MIGHVSHTTAQYSTANCFPQFEVVACCWGLGACTANSVANEQSRLTKRRSTFDLYAVPLVNAAAISWTAVALFQALASEYSDFILCWYLPARAAHRNAVWLPYTSTLDPSV